MSNYRNLSELILDCAEVLRPPERVTVTACAEKNRYLNNPGSYMGLWRTEKAPYLREVMDTLASRYYKECIYVKPAQSGGTEVSLNFILYGAVVDPGDLYFYEATQDKAREFGKDKLFKMVRHCKELRNRIFPGKKGQQAHALRFKNGTKVKLSWPSINELSGHSTGRNLLTDYDRWDDNIGGEGSGFELASKRGQSFGSFAMTFAESSPGRPVLEKQWKESLNTPHMGPPCTGIVSLYNGGDRRRFYWQCHHCHAWFEPCWRRLLFNEHAKDFEAAAAKVVMPCIACGGELYPDEKRDLNLGGVWIRERDFLLLHQPGEWFLPPGVEKKKTKEWEVAVHKPEPYSNRASFWGKGTIAAFMDWPEMVLNYLRAKEKYDLTGDYEGLKKTTNTDQCLPFVEPGQLTERTPDDLMNRAADMGERVVPEWVRFLIATVDVQGRSFVVQVHGIGSGGDICIIDRFSIRKHPERKDRDGFDDDVSPASYEEDWHLLVDQVLLKSYPLDDDSGRRMGMLRVACDSGGAKSSMGGKAGVTAMAYRFYRHLMKQNLADRFRLVRGTGAADSPFQKENRPDSNNRNDRFAGARGDVPVIFINSNMAKDLLDGMLDSLVPGAGMIHFPEWLEDWFYRELCAETRIPGVGWKNLAKKRNEAWDLLVYCLVMMRRLKVERINWENPTQAWAKEWDKNPYVFGGDKAQNDDDNKPDFRKYGEILA